ncbi:MAG: NAD-dependent epimerase/dehydratase family protein [Parachlamydiaceae bacterium]|nr:NAD-dependent epimerase/dehydratase family protein [Parachlamydiaceae bacterium]
MKKNIFITGAAGFIGFHLAKFLHARGDHVVGFDNFNDYYSPKLKHARVNELKNLGIAVIEGDINDRSILEHAIQKHDTTHLVHLAAQAGIRYSLVAPESYIKANINGFLNILEICRSQPSIKLTYASSSSVYGTNTKVPFSIGDSTDHQANLYGVTKKSNELMARNYHKLFGISVTGLRFFTVYGPWGRPDMSYYLFAKAIQAGKPIDVFHEGKMLRDFTYVDDIVSGTAAAIDLGAPCELFNLGNNKPVELMSMISILERLCGKPAIKRFLPMPPGDVLMTYADISHSQERLGFQPKNSLESGLEKFMEWFSSYPE